ncbi:MAG TPA: dTMP kinase [Nitrososphaeraceae archaeon]|nr:dTMP kinase [Nitrososphaeraceae archaeon]
MNKGKIIVIEGTDKAGKGTQSRLLMNALKLSGKICIMMDFPDYTTPIGKEIRSFLGGRRSYAIEVKHLLLSANRWEKKKDIESTIENGIIIIMNRYYQSNLVYGVSHGLNLNWLLNLDRGLPREDVVIVLEVSPDISYRRVPKDRDTFEMDQKLLTEVNKNYRKLAKRFNWKLINGEKFSEEVHNEIMGVVTKILKC